MATVTTKTVTLVEFKRSLVPAKWEDTVRTIGVSEAKEAGLALAHAFAADDLSQYLINADDTAGLSPEEKWRLHVDIMTYMVAAHCYKGVVTTIGPDYECVALWMPPGHDADDWWTMLKSGMLKLYFQMSAESWKRYYDEMLPLLHHTKTEVLGERDNDAYYLVYLGTKPHGRGRGYARKLLEHMIERADAANRPFYLESSALVNNTYYKKFGFEVKKDIFLTRGPVPVQLSVMVREPQPVRRIAFTSAGAGQAAPAAAPTAAATATVGSTAPPIPSSAIKLQPGGRIKA